MAENPLGLDLASAAAALRAADALLITAGAGMGVDSGLPDFRGPQGFWRAYPALARLGLRFEEVAQPGWFRRAPQLGWAFYGHRMNLYRATTPHAGFGQLLALGRSKPLGYFVFTSNVDGHFQKAGFDPERIVECHGSLNHLQCCEPCGEEIWDATGVVVTVNEETFQAQPPLPKCARCHGLARPNVLMFGDATWNPQRSQAQEARLHHWLARLKEGQSKVAIVELGAGTTVPSVRFFSEGAVRDLDAKLIRINPREAEVPPGEIGLPLSAAEGLRQLCQSLKLDQVRADGHPLAADVSRRQTLRLQLGQAMRGSRQGIKDSGNSPRGEWGAVDQRRLTSAATRERTVMAQSPMAPCFESCATSLESTAALSKVPPP